MADITDLTGYTWKANDTLYFSYFQTLEYNINFKSNNVNYTKLKLVWHTDDLLYSSLNYDDIEIYNDLDNVWLDDKYKTIIIVDGTDVSQLFLIEFLQNNGTLIKEGTNKIKLGEANIKMALGGTEISKVYLGNTLVYSK